MFSARCDAHVHFSFVNCDHLIDDSFSTTLDLYHSWISEDKNLQESIVLSHVPRYCDSSWWFPAILSSGTNSGIMNAARSQEDALDVAAPATRSRVTSRRRSGEQVGPAECERAFTTIAPPPLFNRYFLRIGASVELHSAFSITITDIVPLTLTLHGHS